MKRLALFCLVSLTCGAGAARVRAADTVPRPESPKPRRIRTHVSSAHGFCETSHNTTSKRGARQAPRSTPDDPRVREADEQSSISSN
jgi:hypothetical protein